MDEQTADPAPVASAGDPPPLPPPVTEASATPATPPEPAPIGASPSEAEGRERWFRERFEKEHEVTLALMRLLLAGLTSQSRLSRFWRWLIDDFRSERRVLADRYRETDEEKVLIDRVLAWFREQAFFGRRRGPDGHVEGSGP